MNGRMDGWVDGGMVVAWMDRWMGGWVGRWVHGWMGAWEHG